MSIVDHWERKGCAGCEALQQQLTVRDAEIEYLKYMEKTTYAAHKVLAEKLRQYEHQLTEANRREEELKAELEQLAGKMIAAENLGTDVDGYDGYGAAAAIRDLLRRSATSKRGGE